MRDAEEKPAELASTSCGYRGGFWLRIPRCRFSSSGCSVPAVLYRKLDRLGYKTEWQMLNASDFGVPQLRPRFVLVGLRSKFFSNFEWPLPTIPGATVGSILQ